MKKNITFALLWVFLLGGFVACEDEAGNLGQSLRPTRDQIEVKPDTFHLSSTTGYVGKMVSRPDTFLLGSFSDPLFGKTTADILTQVQFPQDYIFPDTNRVTTTPDSVDVTIFFDEVFGSQTSPLEISIYELNKATLDSKATYYTDIDPAEFTDKSILLAKKVITVQDPNDKDTKRTKAVFKLSSDFLKRFFTTDPAVYQSEAKFQQFFKGLYITTSYGSATMLNVNAIYLNLHYHYTYKSDGKEIKNMLTFPANLEVRRVNRVEYSDLSLTFLPTDSLNYVAAPSNLYTKVRIPIKRIKERLTASPDKQLSVNSTILNVSALAPDESKTDYNMVGGLLLIKESELNDFFVDNRLTNDTTSFYAPRKKVAKSTIEYRYDYHFYNLANLISTEIAKESTPDYVDMLLVPVKITANTNAVITSIMEDTQLRGVTIRSGQHNETPLRLEVVYSLF